MDLLDGDIWVQRCHMHWQLIFAVPSSVNTAFVISGAVKAALWSQTKYNLLKMLHLSISLGNTLQFLSYWCIKWTQNYLVARSYLGLPVSFFVFDLFPDIQDLLCLSMYAESWNTNRKTSTFVVNKLLHQACIPNCCVKSFPNGRIMKSGVLRLMKKIRLRNQAKKRQDDL